MKIENVLSLASFFIGSLLMVLLILKLGGYISWPWLLVILPVVFPVGTIIMLILEFIFYKLYFK